MYEWGSFGGCGAGVPRVVSPEEMCSGRWRHDTLPLSRWLHIIRAQMNAGKGEGGEGGDGG